jgi:pimeloyl-ACP methyl ester carboxylesterase
MLAVLAVAGLASACTSGAPAAPGGAGSASSPAGATPASPSSGSAGSSSGGASYAAGSAAIVPAQSRLNWQSCGSSLAGLECTSIQVPLNYADPGGRKITIALSMVPATAPASQQQGVLLVNPGGPGEPGRSLAGSVAGGVSDQVRADYDIVGFDPRGVGGSSPVLSCDPGFFSAVRPDYIPASAAAEQVLIGRAKSYAADCEQRYGWFLPYETTQNAARDMDRIRQFFGVRQVSYYAFSYGTYLGQVYGTMFPRAVRRMVLDSTVDPDGAWYADNISQDYAFEARLKTYFSWIAKYNGSYGLGQTEAQVQASYDEIRTRLEKSPAQGKVGPDELDDTIIYSGYTDQVWAPFAQALSEYLNSGSAADLVSQYEAWGVQDDNADSVYNAVECADVAWPRNWSKWQADTERVYKTAPFQAWDNAWFNAACAFWAVKGPAKPPAIDGSQLPPILMLQGTLDAATPYAGAQNAHKHLPSARMVVVEGGGNHGQSLETPANTCVQNYLNAYLSAGTLPQKPGLVNATCQPTPPPTPN